MAQAKLIESLDTFLDVLEKSKLFAAEQVSKFRQDLDGASTPPIEIARKLVKNRKLTKWQAGQLLAGHARLRLGKYVLRDQLGKGRLGTLFLAHDEKGRRLVALRLLSKEAASDPARVKQCVAAAQAAAVVEHPQVARVFEVNGDSERPVVISEYVDGADLQSRVEEDGPLTAERARRYLEQAVAGLTAAHDQQVVHGSLAPSRLLVQSDDNLQIVDWGLAPLGDGEAGFLPPEAKPGQPASVATDVYSLGASIRYCLTGQVPSAESTAAGGDQGAGRLLELCQAMMATDVAERPASMRDIASRLSALDSPEVANLEEVELEPLALEPNDMDAGELVDDPQSEAATALDDRAAPAKARPQDKPPQPTEAETGSGEDRGGAPLPEIEVADAHKTAPIADTAAFQISTGKESSGGPVGDFKISTKRKKKKAKPSRTTQPASTDEDVAATTEQAAAPAKQVRRAAGKAASQPTPQPETPASEPSQAAAADDTVEPADGPVEKAQKKKAGGPPVVLIIAGVALFGLIFLGGSAGLAVWFLMSGGEEKVVASAADPEVAEASGEAAAETPEIDPEDIPLQPILVDDEPAEAADEAASDDESSTSADTPSPPATGDVAAAPAGSGDDAPVTPEAGAATPDVPMPATPEGGLAAASDTDAEQPAATAPAPAAADASTAATDVEKAAEEEAAEKKAQAVAAAEQLKKDEAAKKAAAEKKAEEEKKKNAGPVFVFQPTIDLPAVPAAGETAAPIELGKVNIEETDVCFISMTGGDSAARGRGEFALRNANSGTAPRDWEFVLTDSGAATVIATMSLPENGLMFQWLPAAADNQYASNLRNCSLKITAGTAKPLEFALRSPVVGESLPIDLTKSTMQGRWNVEAPPDPSALQISASVKGYKVVLEPPQPISAVKGTQWIYLGDNQATSVLALKMDSSVSARGIQVALKPYLTIPGQKPVAYNKATKKKVTQELAQRNTLQSKVIFFSEQLSKAPKQQKPQIQALLTQAEQQLQSFDKMAQMVSQLEQIEQNYSMATIDFEVTYRTLQGATVLVKTEAGG